MQSYLDLLRHVLHNGKDRTDRTGTRAVFGYQWSHDLAHGFPLLTTKKIFTKGVVHELLWFLKGGTNIKYLNDNGVHIWDEWADENGELGPVYGKQWRCWVGVDQAGRTETVDQLQQLIDNARKSPDSRRLIVSAWNPVDVPMMALPPCHTLWQVQVEPKTELEPSRLNLHLYARSIDSFLGLPFNIASYALLASMLACVLGHSPGKLIISFGDLHIYKNHMDQVNEQLLREPRSLPTLRLTPRDNITDFKFDDIEFMNYDPHPAIKAPIAV